jgi:hypothetical protein
MAKQRDNFKCVLTSGLFINAAPIYPFCSLGNKKENIFEARHTFWNHLKIFWPKEKVTAWTAELFPRGINEIGVDRIYNLVILSSNAYGYWNRGAFALKPISVNEDKTTLKVKFFWQKKKTILKLQ